MHTCIFNTWYPMRMKNYQALQSRLGKKRNTSFLTQERKKQRTKRNNKSHKKIGLSSTYAIRPLSKDNKSQLFTHAHTVDSVHSV